MTDRRVFDDLFAKALNDVGVQGLPGYQFIEKATASEDAFDAGVAKSGADGLLLVRLLGVDTRTQVTTTMVPASSVSTFGPRGPWSPAWGPSWYAVPDIRQFQVADVIEQQGRAILGKHLCDSQSDTSGRSGDQRHLALEIHGSHRPS